MTSKRSPLGRSVCYKASALGEPESLYALATIHWSLFCPRENPHKITSLLYHGSSPSIWEYLLLHPLYLQASLGSSFFGGLVLLNFLFCISSSLLPMFWVKEIHVFWSHITHSLILRCLYFIAIVCIQNAITKKKKKKKTTEMVYSSQLENQLTWAGQGCVVYKVKWLWFLFHVKTLHCMHYIEMKVLKIYS